MANDTSDRFGLPLLQSGQAQKELTHNEALALIDMLLHPCAQSATLTAPPVGAAIGQCWIVASTATAEWSGHDDEIACLTSGGWRFVAPRAGTRVSTADDGVTRVFDGSAWTLDAVRPDGLYVAGVRVAGARAAAIADPAGGGVVDAEARAAVGLVLSALRGHGLIA